MSTHAAASKSWSRSELDALTIENDFRLRGAEVTRLDTFVDATFAFVLTLLVISFDDLPSSHAEMIAAAKRIPAFAASFGTLMMFWLQHRRWGRRYGLENRRTLLLSLLFIFVVLVYVYPLRMIFEGMFSNLTGDYLTSDYRLDSYDDLRMLFVFYSMGFLVLSLVIGSLYWAALSQSTQLALNKVERYKTKMDMQRWFIAGALAIVSIVLSATLQERWVILGGYVYISFFGLAYLPEFFAKRRGQSAP